MAPPGGPCAGRTALRRGLPPLFSLGSARLAVVRRVAPRGRGGPGARRWGRCPPALLADVRPLVGALNDWRSAVQEGPGEGPRGGCGARLATGAWGEVVQRERRELQAADGARGQRQGPRPARGSRARPARLRPPPSLIFLHLRLHRQDLPQRLRAALQRRRGEREVPRDAVVSRSLQPPPGLALHPANAKRR